MNSIAQQCPAAGGEAVFRARAMLALVNDSIVYDDVMACLQSGIYKQSTQPEKKFDFELIPNPSRDAVIVKMINAKSGICNMKIVNVLGNSVLESKIDCEQIEHLILTHNLMPGMYFVNVEFEQERGYSSKSIHLIPD
jgi:hypothetical protein